VTSVNFILCIRWLITKCRMGKWSLGDSIKRCV